VLDGCIQPPPTDAVEAWLHDLETGGTTSAAPNTLTGLRGVPAATLEAARAMGLTPRQSLFRVEIPLAGPARPVPLRRRA
jgi:ABC-type nitrate/sulfonate/bicarbonate transport system permease component